MSIRCAPARSTPVPIEPPQPSQTVRILQPAQTLLDISYAATPIVCKEGALSAPVTASAPIGNAGSEIALQHDGARRASLRVGSHSFGAPLTYSVTAEASDEGEFRFEMRRTDTADVPADKAPNSFTFQFHYPSACQTVFRAATNILLVRLSDNTAIPASARDTVARTVTFRMDRLSRFVISH